jgi:monofunctional glycosyltransferase
VARSRSPLRGLVIAWKAFSYTLGALVVAFIIAQGWFFAHVLYFTYFEPASTAFMDRTLEQLRDKNPRARLAHKWVPYERVSANLKRAVVAAEDARFLDHEGFDWEMIQKAIVKNERRGRVVAGASTISQQLAKNLFLSGERSWLRKGQEAIITWMLETVMSKRRILELYLNIAEWGDGVFGAEAAARHHFGVPAGSLSVEQAAWLAAILPSPKRYDRGRLTAYLAGRVDTIMARMPSAQIPPGENPQRERR